MPKQRLVLILGTVLALITALLVKAWMAQQKNIFEEEAKQQALQQKEKVISILVAKKEIPAGSPIEPDFVEQKSFSEKQVTLDAVTSLDRIQGMVTIANILQNEPITITKLAFPQGASGLAEATPVGRRAISISVDNIAAVAGMVKPGNYVDVIVLLSFPVQLADGKQMTDNRVIPLFQNVEVLAVGHSTVGAAKAAGRYTQEKPEETKQSQSPLITLSLTPKEAGILAYISETGKIRLVLRNPQDSKMEPLEVTSLESLLRYLSPQQAEKKEIPKPTNFIEVYRGMNKETMPIRD